jgi:hypothetical protein
MISALGGGVLRVVPEVLSYFQKKSDNEHELAMMDKQIVLGEQQGRQRMADAELQGDINQMLAALQVQGEALKGQAQLTGVWWIDALNMLVRPLVTYWLLALYSVAKFAMLIVAMRQSDPWTAVTTIWGADDAAMLAGVFSFWFVGRVFDKRK